MTQHEPNLPISSLGQQAKRSYDLYDVFPFSYSTAEQVRMHDEAISRTREDRNSSYKPFPYVCPALELLTMQVEAENQF